MRCEQRLDEGDDDSLDTNNLPGVLLLSITSTSATDDLVPVCISSFSHAVQQKT